MSISCAVSIYGNQFVSFNDGKTEHVLRLHEWGTQEQRQMVEETEIKNDSLQVAYKIASFLILAGLMGTIGGLMAEVSSIVSLLVLSLSFGVAMHGIRFLMTHHLDHDEGADLISRGFMGLLSIAILFTIGASIYTVATDFHVVHSINLIASEYIGIVQTGFGFVEETMQQVLNDWNSIVQVADGSFLEELYQENIQSLALLLNS